LIASGGVTSVNPSASTALWRLNIGGGSVSNRKDPEMGRKSVTCVLAPVRCTSLISNLNLSVVASAAEASAQAVATAAARVDAGLTTGAVLVSRVFFTP
jgi:hypothetical protein